MSIIPLHSELLKDRAFALFIFISSHIFGTIICQGSCSVIDVDCLCHCFDHNAGWQGWCIDTYSISGLKEITGPVLSLYDMESSNTSLTRHWKLIRYSGREGRWEIRFISHLHAGCNRRPLWLIIISPHTHYQKRSGIEDTRTPKHREGIKVESRRQGIDGVREELWSKPKKQALWRRLLKRKRVGVPRCLALYSSLVLTLL